MKERIVSLLIGGAAGYYVGWIVGWTRGFKTGSQDERVRWQYVFRNMFPVTKDAGRHSGHRVEEGNW